MRLLRLENDSELAFAEFIGNIPQYAILSHTWGSDGDEITFDEVKNKSEALKEKAGYKKISFCIDQATKDGLQYVWIDTCCIDKSSSAELSEAINSMFRWYQEASKCYVYLSDVSADSFARGKSDFQNSRWFTRGWTLQELVAPNSVEFFSLEGKRLGDKRSLVKELTETTGIPVEALHGCPLSDFSIAERLSWAAKRETKREEDSAYALMGIFDVQMPLLYGERRERALNRLHRVIQESAEYQPSLSLAPDTMISTSIARLQPQAYSTVSSTGFASDNQLVDAQQRILDSLQFSQIQERRHQIHEAYGDTYQWVLQPMAGRSQKWDDLTAWLSSSTDPRRIYWIHGKPGSGKSTLMRFIDENVGHHHLVPWAKEKAILGAQYFFWNPGTKLQKTLTGLLRTLLLQLLEQQPLLIPKVVDQRKWSTALRPGNNPIEWTDTELKHSLCRFVQVVRGSANIFLLLDGLDELDGSDDTREELTNFLFKLSSSEHVKICASSRPWNHFLDAFEEFPQLKLEDLTRDDIYMYVSERLCNNTRFKHLVRCDAARAEDLVIHIISKASGVFLWVCLVVRGLLQGLRDGHDIETLMRNLQEIPEDLGHYFASLMSSIDIHQRKEASMILQIVLYEEKEFATLHPLTLIDLCFIDEKRPDFVLSGQYDFGSFDLINPRNLKFRLESMYRRLGSRCMGLIECHYSAYRGQKDDNLDSDPLGLGMEIFSNILRLETEEKTQSRNQKEDSEDYKTVSRRALDMHVEFLHRSCMDFLSTPEMRSMLEEQTNGPYDARLFLLNARVALFMAIVKIPELRNRAIGLASYILCSLARPSYRNSPVSSSTVAVMQDRLESLFGERLLSPRVYWYISPSMSSWHDEQSSCLTLAIDFRLNAYVKEHMTRQSILDKPGRPILDYILRPRFQEVERAESISSQIPNVELLQFALSLGADPNQLYGSTSVWALFLRFLANTYISTTDGEDEVPDYSSMVELMIKAGASTLLPKSWLQQDTAYQGWNDFTYQDTSTNGRLPSCWRKVVPVFGSKQDNGSETWYTVSNLLQQIDGDLRLDVCRLRKLLYSREAKAR